MATWRGVVRAGVPVVVLGFEDECGEPQVGEDDAERKHLALVPLHEWDKEGRDVKGNAHGGLTALDLMFEREETTLCHTITSS